MDREQKLLDSFEVLESGMRDMRTGFDQLKTAVVGNPEFGIPGIVSEIKSLKATAEELNKRITKVTNREFKQKALIAAGGLAAGATGKTLIAKIAAWFTFLK